MGLGSSRTNLIGAGAARSGPGLHSSGFPEDALDHSDGDRVDLGGLGDRQRVIHPGSDARMFGPRDLARGPGLGVDRCRDFLVAARCRLYRPEAGSAFGFASGFHSCQLLV